MQQTQAVYLNKFLNHSYLCRHNRRVRLLLGGAFTSMNHLTESNPIPEIDLWMRTATNPNRINAAALLLGRAIPSDRVGRRRPIASVVSWIRDGFAAPEHSSFVSPATTPTRQRVDWRSCAAVGSAIPWCASQWRRARRGR